jgi:hypothetical protein
VAGDNGEVGDRLERVQVLGRHLAPLHEADRERAAQLAVPAHRDADAGADVGQDEPGGQRHLVLVVGGQHGSAARQHLTADPLAQRQAVAEPLLRAVVARGGERRAVLVDQVDAGHRAADGEAGLARQRVEHRPELERDVQRMRGAGQRLVAPALGDAAPLGLQPGQAQRGLVGERLGDEDLVGRPHVRGVVGHEGDVADVAGPGDRHEQRGPCAQPGGQRAAELGDRLGLVERQRARGRRDVRGGRWRVGGRQHLDGPGRQRAVGLRREGGDDVGGRVRREGHLGEAAQGRVRGLRAGAGG